MKLTVLGSSSAGNCYILQNESEALILEAGIGYNAVKRALGFNVRKVAGCLITHEHGDHAGHVKEFLAGAVPVYTSEGTAEALKLEGTRAPHICRAGELLTLGRFKVIPFDTKHDSAQPFGFLLQHPETGTVLFATDTYYLPCTFRGLNNILIECNYAAEILDENIREGRIPKAVRNRTLKSHFSYKNCLAALQANDLRAVNNIVLIHLSASNADPQAFRNGVHTATGKRVFIAEPGLNIEFNVTPF